jgi:hypothetical protein
VIRSHLKNTSLPFKGRARVGMGQKKTYPTPILAFPLRGKELMNPCDK